MATNITNEKIKDSFPQLLHIDGGVGATDKTVYSGTGTATALKVGTGSAAVDNLHFDGNTISALNTNGGITLTPNGTGAVTASNVAITGGNITGLTNLGASNATITGGTISGVVFTGSFSGITSISSDAFNTSAVAAGLTLSDNDLLADGTDTNIDIDLIPKGTGAVKATRLLATTSVGYAAGLGGAITQATSRTTGVTLNAPTGQITMLAGSLAGHEADEFVLTNSYIGATDVIVVNIASGAASATRKYYQVHVCEVSAGSCVISVGNIDNATIPTTGTDSPVITFAIIKGVIA